MELTDTIIIGEITIEPLRRIVIRDGQESTIDPLVMRLLTCLAVNSGRVVTREELISEVWPDGYAGDQSLSRAIWGLRRALGDDAENPLYIETVPRVGYRMLPDVTLESFQKEALEATPPAQERAVESNGIDVENLHVAALTRTVQRLKFALFSMSAVGVFLVAALVMLPEQVTENTEIVKVRLENGTVDSVVVRSDRPINLESSF